MTQIRQRAIRTSDTKRDDLPAGVTAETEATTIEEDANAFRSALRRALGLAKWYDALTAPTALETGTARGIQNLNDALHLMEKKRIIRSVIRAANVTVGAAENFVILGTGTIPVQTTAAVGDVTTLGTVVAPHGGTFGTHSLAVVTGEPLSPKNLVTVLDAATRNPVLSEGRTVWGLLHGASGLLDGATITDSGTTRVQISFVRQNESGSAFEAVPAADIQGLTIRYSSRTRIRFEDLAEVAFEPGAVVNVGGAGDGGESGDYILLTSEIRTLVDTVDGTEIDDGVYLLEATEADFGNLLKVAPSANEKLLHLPGRFELGTRLSVQYQQSFQGPVNNLLVLGAQFPDPETGTLAFVLTPGSGPYEGLPPGHTVDLMFTDIFDTGPGGIYHVWSIVGGTSFGGGGGGDGPNPSNDTPQAPSFSGASGSSDDYSRADHSHPEQYIPPAAPGDKLRIIVGNSLEGDTLADCDYLDDGTGAEFVNACNSGRSQFGTSRVALRPGTYQLTQQIFVRLGSETPDLTIEAAVPDSSVNIVIGDSRECFYFGFNNPIDLKFVGVQIEVAAIETAANGTCVLGDFYGLGVVTLENSSIYFSGTGDINESVVTAIKANNIHLRSGSVSGPGALLALGRDDPFTSIQASGEARLSGGSSIYGADVAVRANWVYISDEATVYGAEGDVAICTESLYTTGGLILAGLNGACVASQYGNLIYTSKVTVDARNTQFGSYMDGAVGPIGVVGLFDGCTFFKLEDGVRPWTGDISYPVLPIRFVDCVWDNVLRRAVGAELMDNSDMWNPLVVYSPEPQKIGFNVTEYTPHLRGAPGDLPGDAAGFAVHCLVRPSGYPTDMEVIIGNYNRFQAQGGWFMGCNGTQFKFGAGRGSDNTIVESFAPSGLADLAPYLGRFIDRLFLLSMEVSGSAARCFVNGRLVDTLTLTGGYAPADAGNRPMIGRNINPKTPAYAVNMAFVQGAYSLTPDYDPPKLAQRQYRKWIKNARIMHELYDGGPLTDLWGFQGDRRQIATDMGSLTWELINYDGEPTSFIPSVAAIPMPVRFP